MNGFTSGTQALQGRKVNHDPEPWVDLAHGNRHSETDLGAYAGMVFPVPRPEFDVLDNPILRAFREEYESAGKWNWEDKQALTYAWLRKFREPWLDEAECWTNAEIDHARRVLTKLAALA